MFVSHFQIYFEDDNNYAIGNDFKCCSSVPCVPLPANTSRDMMMYDMMIPDMMIPACLPCVPLPANTSRDMMMYDMMIPDMMIPACLLPCATW